MKVILCVKLGVCATLVIPSSTVSCERGFSKQNLIKEMKRNRLNIEHLDDLMRVSLNGPHIEEIQWDRDSCI